MTSRAKRHSRLLLLLLLLLLTDTFALFLTVRILLPRAHGLVEPEAFV
jgi:hypothetical protein